MNIELNNEINLIMASIPFIPTKKQEAERAFRNADNLSRKADEFFANGDEVRGKFYARRALMACERGIALKAG